MDDNELDRLFGRDTGSEDPAPDDEDKAVKDGEAVPDPEEEQSSEGSDAGNPFTLEPYDEPSAVTEDVLDDDGDDEADAVFGTDDDLPEDELPGDGSEETEKAAEPAKDDIRPEQRRLQRKPSGQRAVSPEKRIKKTAQSSAKSISDAIPLTGKSIFAICVALALVIMAVLIAFLPAFRVKNAHIEGNVVLTEQEILNEVGLDYNAHLMSGVSGNIFDVLRLNYGKTEQRVKKENPYIEDITVSVKIPSTVNIRIKERSKICYIRTPDGYAALDKDGIVLELSSFDSKKEVRPVICGLNIKSAELGKPVKISNSYDYKKAIIVLGAILAADNASVGGSYSMFENTSEVRILPSGYIFLTIYSPSGNLIQIKLDSTDDISDDMAWLLYAFNSDVFDKTPARGSLDMTDDDPTFREY